MRFIALSFAAVVLGACVMPSPQPIVRPAPDPLPGPISPEGCDASRYQHLVGGPLPDPFPRQGNVRVYQSDMSVTMDYDPNRLNVEVHPESRQIVSIACG